jgi:hypothetical protein
MVMEIKGLVSVQNIFRKGAFYEKRFIAGFMRAVRRIVRFCGRSSAVRGSSAL